jgi:hypothetical protein
MLLVDDYSVVKYVRYVRTSTVNYDNGWRMRVVEYSSPDFGWSFGLWISPP